MYSKNTDPLFRFYNEYGYHSELIKEFIIGEKYAALISTEGTVGLAANLFNLKNFDFKFVQSFDFKNYTHRLFLLAYYNSILNYRKHSFLFDDIFKLINFSSYYNIVMVGYSEPMTKKLNALQIEPIIFDAASTNKIIMPQNKMPEFLKSANSVILTGTSLINNTFSNLIKQVNENCDVWLVGPSVPVTSDILKFQNVKGVFGTIFKSNDRKIIDLIKNNKGTNCLKKYGTKVGLLNTEDGNL